MARKRSISTDIAIDGAVNKLARECGDFAALLYTWMIPFAEDNCEITGDPDELLSLVCPGRRDKDENDVINAIDGMLSQRLIYSFTKNGKPMLLFPPTSFYKFQSYINVKNRDYRPVEERGDNIISNEQNKTAENTAEQQETPENAVSLSLSLSPSLTKQEKENARAHEPHPEENKSDASKLTLPATQKNEAELFKFFNSNIGMVTPFQAETLSKYLDDGLDPGMISAVMKDSLGMDNKWGWINKVLENSLKINVKTIEQYEAHKLERANARSRDKPPGKSISKKAIQAGNFEQRKYSDDDFEKLYKDI